ncbi:hypothetical protein CN601_05620 [Bacillus sp. AFS017336]|nr:hypothetical protein CN601_05620 [Bacillus sp. AFS017336]
MVSFFVDFTKKLLNKPTDLNPTFFILPDRLGIFDIPVRIQMHFSLNMFRISKVNKIKICK